jgi:hypothetical protein
VKLTFNVIQPLVAKQETKIQNTLNTHYKNRKYDEGKLAQWTYMFTPKIKLNHSQDQFLRAKLSLKSLFFRLQCNTKPDGKTLQPVLIIYVHQKS